MKEQFQQQQREQQKGHAAALSRIKEDTQSVLAPTLLHDPRLQEQIQLVHLFCSVQLTSVTPVSCQTSTQLFQEREKTQAFQEQQRAELKRHEENLARIRWLSDGG